MISPQWLELPMSRTNFHGPKDVRAIEVQLYFVSLFIFKLVAEPSGPGFALNVPVEVVIGNIPFATVAQQHGMTIQPNAPLQSYAESAFGRVNTLDDDEKNTTGNLEYAPMYGYYKWEKDPANHFRV